MSKRQSPCDPREIFRFLKYETTLNSYEYLWCWKRVGTRNRFYPNWISCKPATAGFSLLLYERYTLNNQRHGTVWVTIAALLGPDLTSRPGSKLFRDLVLKLSDRQHGAVVLNGQRHPAELAQLAGQVLILLAAIAAPCNRFKRSTEFVEMATGGTYPTRPVAEEQLEGGRQGAHSPGHSVLSLSLSISVCVYVCESSLSSTGALKIPGQEAGACCAFTVNLVVTLSRTERGA